MAIVFVTVKTESFTFWVNVYIRVGINVRVVSVSLCQSSICVLMSEKYLCPNVRVVSVF